MAVFTNGNDDPPFNPLAPPFDNDSDPVQYGLDGDDVIIPTIPFPSYLDGGRGNDLIISHALPDVVVGGEGNDTIVNRGGEDSLYGGSGNDTIVGGDAIDTIEGNGGDDSLNGALGNDIIEGGRGLDKFQFSTTLDATNNVDTIVDFRPDQDHIVLDATIFTALVPGSLSKGAFFEGKKAHDGNDRIIYNEKNGKLFYDDDGKGNDTKVQFALLDKHLDLHNTDFLIVA